MESKVITAWAEKPVWQGYTGLHLTQSIIINTKLEMKPSFWAVQLLKSRSFGEGLSALVAD